jgi:uncharacterized cupredoxin-like copper-binding protein
MALMDMDGMSGMHQGDTAHKMDHGDKAHTKWEEGLKKRIAELDPVAAASDSVHVLPGEAKDITWGFDGPTLPVFGCHIPGHWQEGMKGSFVQE